MTGSKFVERTCRLGTFGLQPSVNSEVSIELLMVFDLFRSIFYQVYGPSKEVDCNKFWHR